ncbi:MAG: hypothetical protein LQ351_006697 [Letrouitia transgressa]|nr:MAG: hypothetical protein LQ351_006697 [Letrouitia transgressa]
MLLPSAPIEGVSVLHGLIRNELDEYVSEALEAGTDPNWASKFSSSPLVAAVDIADTVSLRLLLDAGADVHKYSYLDEDANIFKIEHDFELGCKMLSPIQWAAALNHVEIAEILCEAGANVNQPPCETDGDVALSLAVRRNNMEIITFLAAQEVDVNAGCTALHDAIKYGYDEMIIEWLLRYGADPNETYFDDSLFDCEYQERSPLEQACYCYNVDAIRSLLRAGADINQGCALLSFFGDNEDEDYDDFKMKILEVLLSYEVDVNKRYYNTDTPLQSAIKGEEFECAYLLIEAGARINDPASEGEEGRTALQAAASVGSVDLVEQLLLRGADVNTPAADVNGVTALQAAAIKGYLRIAQILLEHGADIDAEAGIKNGRTAIEGAAEFGRIDMVKFLLDNYQGPKPISEICVSAYKAAKKGNQWFVMELLENYERTG